jgi:integrase
MREDGSVNRTQVGRAIAPVCDQYRSKKAVMPLVEKLLKTVNGNSRSPESAATLEHFVEQTYLPYVEEHKRPSTIPTYKAIWRHHLKPRCGNRSVRDFRTVDGENLLAEIGRQTILTRSTLARIKSLLSGVFNHAKRIGVFDGVNPIQDVSIPKGRPSSETYACSLEEIATIVSKLPQPAATIVATAAFTGMRKGELRGLLWENYNQEEIRITQSVWQSIVTEPKTTKSKAPVPVIAPLARALDNHRLRQGNPQTGLIFASEKGTPLDLSNLTKRVIRPCLEKKRLRWPGWHAFRRGLATNLYRLGVADKTIQSILRHANLSTTMNSYVKSVPAGAVEAMRSLEEICTQYAPQLRLSDTNVA